MFILGKAKWEKVSERTKSDLPWVQVFTAWKRKTM